MVLSYFCSGLGGMADSQDEESQDYDSPNDELDENPSEPESPPRKVRKAAQVAHLAWSGKQPKTSQMLARKASGYSLSAELLFDYEACKPLPEHKIGRTDHQTFYTCVYFELLPQLARTRSVAAVPIVIAATSVVKLRGEKDWMIVCSIYRNNDKGNWRFFGEYIVKHAKGKGEKPEEASSHWLCDIVEMSTARAKGMTEQEDALRRIQAHKDTQTARRKKRVRRALFMD